MAGIIPMKLKLSIRALIKNPFVTIVAVVSLALGIGANAAIFSLFHQILLRDLPVPEPDRLVTSPRPDQNKAAHRAETSATAIPYSAIPCSATGAATDGV